jgi:hypothetical protein
VFITSPRPVPDSDLKLRRRIDELHLPPPFAGARMLRDFLRQKGLNVGRRHISTLMGTRSRRRSRTASRKQSKPGRFNRPPL